MSGVLDSGDEGEDDGFEQESDALDQFGTLVGDGVQRLRAEHVPLTVVADVVNQWTRDGNAGAWTLGTVDSALRRGGRGNHPWYVVFADNGTLRAWRVSRGGRAKQEPTVVEVQM